MGLNHGTLWVRFEKHNPKIERDLLNHSLTHYFSMVHKILHAEERRQTDIPRQKWWACCDKGHWESSVRSQADTLGQKRTGAEGTL